jgi:hypothetical protein
MLDPGSAGKTNAEPEKREKCATLFSHSFACCWLRKSSRTSLAALRRAFEELEMRSSLVPTVTMAVKRPSLLASRLEPMQLLLAQSPVMFGVDGPPYTDDSSNPEPDKQQKKRKL